MRKKEEYIFVSSLVRGDEETFLETLDYDKLIELKTVNQQMSYLQSFKYGDGKELVNQRDYELHLRNELKRVYSVIDSLPDRKELEFLLLPNDFHNVKAILKAEALNIDPKPYLVDNGTIDKDKLLKDIKEKNYPFITNSIKDGINLANIEFSKAKDPQMFDIVLDKCLYKEMLKEATKIGNDFILGYIKLLIDLINVSTFIRLREVGKDVKFFKDCFLEGGNVTFFTYQDNYEESYTKVAEKFMSFGLDSLFLNGAISFTNNNEFTTLEKGIDNMKISYLKKSHYLNYGIEIPFSYILAKEIEIKNLRMVLGGKLTNEPNDIVKERLRDTYV